LVIIPILLLILVYSASQRSASVGLFDDGGAFYYKDDFGNYTIDSSDVFDPEKIRDSKSASIGFTSVRNTMLALPLSIPVKYFEFSPKHEK